MLGMEFIKLVHVVCAILSGCGFFIRGVLMVRESAYLQAWPIKILPHVLDTVLLVSAIILASQWGWAALQMPWLLAKIVALLLYIGLGTVALHRGKTKTKRISAWLVALLVFVYILVTAVTKNPLLFL